MALSNGACCVITGAASGFGRALALELASRGASLHLGDVDEAGCEETARRAREVGAAQVRVVRCDVSRAEEIETLANGCVGKIDLVINNAGVSSAGAIGELSLEDWRWTLGVDLWGVIHGCHVFVPRLKRQGHGHVLNVASAAGLISAPNMAAYNVAKAGVVALSETLRAELDGTGIGVTVACPTFFKTGIAEGGRFVDPALRKTAVRLVAAGKTPEEVARATLAAVKRRELYALPMADGRWAWRMKRIAPDRFAKMMAKVGRKMQAK